MNIKLRSDLPPLSYSYLPKDERARHGAYSINFASSWFATNVIRRINGYPWGFVAVPRTDKEYSISLRSTPGSPNVAKIAQVFGGGGHALASGAKIVGDDLDGEMVCKKVLEYLMNNPVELEGISEK
jgi:c-di-AMP phosphodiesterase-like protein